MEIEIIGMTVVDDGTLDTIIGVSGTIGYREYRYNLEQEPDETREDIINIARGLAMEDYYSEEL